MKQPIKRKEKNEANKQKVLITHKFIQPWIAIKVHRMMGETQIEIVSPKQKNDFLFVTIFLSLQNFISFLTFL